MVKCFALGALALGQHASALQTPTTPPTPATAGAGGPCNTGGCAASAPVGWSFAGPSTYHDRGDDSGMTSAGAAQNVAAGADGTWFLGSVNGGVWRTSTLRHARPGWTNVLDGQPVTCSSISALHVSATDARRVYAGCGGSTSSEQGSDWNVLNSGDWAGIMASADGGDTWRMLPAFPDNYYVTDILEPSPGTLLVSAQSHLYDRDDGGIWRSTDGGASFAKVEGAGPTFTLQAIEGGAKVLATHARSAAHAVSISTDGGATFADYGRLPWAAGASPFYTCAAPLGDGRLVVAGLTRLSSFPNATSSQFFVRSAAATADAAATWTAFEQPTSMDEDSMPKDRMAILGDPELKDLLYVSSATRLLVPSRLLPHSLTHSLTHSFTHSFAHSLTHSLTHSSTCCNTPGTSPATQARWPGASTSPAASGPRCGTRTRPTEARNRTATAATTPGTRAAPRTTMRGGSCS